MLDQFSGGENLVGASVRCRQQQISWIVLVSGRPSWVDWKDGARPPFPVSFTGCLECGNTAGNITDDWRTMSRWRHDERRGAPARTTGEAGQIEGNCWEVTVAV